MSDETTNNEEASVPKTFRGRVVIAIAIVADGRASRHVLAVPPSL